MEMDDFNQKVIKEFRANEGKVGGNFAGAPMLLLTTTGAKSGQQRTTPLVYSKDGENVVIIASFGGAPKHPAWFLNIKAHPEVTVEVGKEKYTARAVVPEGTERDRLFNQQAALMPNFAEYQEKTTRRIPAVVLEKVK
jgi:deazaflavin-dependent oxidoreductase (nitroreductase family)